MRIRPISGIDRLRDAVTMIEAAFPLWSERTGRDFNYFARRFPSDGSLYLALEDAAGTIGVALPTVEQDIVVLDTEFVAPSADSPSARDGGECDLGGGVGHERYAPGGPRRVAVGRDV